MNSITRLLSLLADGRFHSGEDLGRELAISRTAVWKKIKSLQRYGISVHSVKGKGYRLSRAIEFLDREKIIASIDSTMKPVLRRLTLHEQIDSTNRFLLDQTDTPDFHAHVALAEFQSAGRGRRGHGWISPYAAGICLSAGWHFETPPEPLTGISLGTGVAIMRALCKAGIKGAGLKWPNDIFWQGRKLGGTLVEMRAESTGPCNVVIGIGINYSFPPEERYSIDQPWVDIATIRRDPVSRNVFTAMLISELFGLLTEIRNGGFGEILDEWRQHDHMKGRHATLLLPDRTVTGLLLGVDDSGALLMSIDDQVKKFNSGEISLRVQH